ncbi:MAG: MepB family protein [Parachlamydiales bacterium]|jgi:hypothetical protein
MNKDKDLLEAQKAVYEPLGLHIKHYRCEFESQEYGAAEFEIDSKQIKYRKAKITPIKVGQFVTLWKREGTGPIMPFDLSDPVDLFIITVRTEQHFGQFIFPKTVLVEKGILSTNGVGGKRAMRVYPSWDFADNNKARKTQAWQLGYFFDFNNLNEMNLEAIKARFTC